MRIKEINKKKRNNIKHNRAQLQLDSSIIQLCISTIPIQYYTIIYRMVDRLLPARSVLI